ncbi:MAG: hypothetical protein ABI305_08395, partial [Tepidiformaceae bacterium]
MRAQARQLHLTTEQFAYESTGPQGESVVVALNLAESPFEFTRPRPVREALAQKPRRRDAAPGRAARLG